jgi:hypothetical protein
MPLKVNRRFGGTRNLILQDKRRKQSLLATFFTLVYCLLSDPEDGGNMFLRNVG